MKTLLIGLSIILSVNYSEACSCTSFIDEFCHAADEEDNIVLVKFLDLLDFSVGKFEVLDNINQIISEDTINILGADGLNCGYSLSDFDLGDTLILNLSGGDTTLYNYYGNEYSWFLADCARHNLDYIDGNVIGPITKEIDSISYDVFKDEIIDCFDFYLNSTKIVEIEFELFPNPARSKVLIGNSDLVIEDISVFDLSGKMVLTYSSINSKLKFIDINSLNNGVYLVVISTSEGVIRKKLIKA